MSTASWLRRSGAVAAVLGLVAVAGTARAEDPAFLTIGGGPTGGTFNVVATGLADLLRDEFTDSTIDVQPGGSGPNLLRVAAGQADLGITSANNASDVWHGRPPAPDGQELQNIRGLMTFFPSAIQIWVPADSDIESIEDLRGKQVSAGQPGQTSWNAFMALLDAYGMGIEDIESDGGRLHRLSWSESHNAMRDGKLDAIMWVSLYPHSTVLATEANMPVRTLSFDPDQLETFLASSAGGGFERVTLPADLYAGQEEPAETVGTTTFLFTNAAMPDDVARRTLDTIWTNLERFKQTHSLLAYMSEETVGKGMAVPLHPAAIAFFEEHGMEYGPVTLD